MVIHYYYSGMRRKQNVATFCFTRIPCVSTNRVRSISCPPMSATLVIRHQHQVMASVILHYVLDSGNMSSQIYNFSRFLPSALNLSFVLSFLNVLDILNGSKLVYIFLACIGQS